MSLIISNLESALTPNHLADDQRLTVTGASVVSLAALHSRTQVVLVSVEDVAVRVTYDGSAPGATNGHLLAVGTELYLSRETAEALKALSTAGDAVLHVTEFRYRATNVRRESMQTRRYVDLQNAVIRLKELDPNTAELSAAQLEVVAEHITQAMQEAWEFEAWPELTVVERRDVVEEELLDDDGAVEDTLRYVQRRASGYWPIGTCYSISARNPKASQNPGRLSFSVVMEGYAVGELAGTQVWVEYKLEPSRFTAVPWKANESYSAGDLRFWSATGEVYECLADVEGGSGVTPGNLEYWDVCPVPRLFFDYVRLQAGAMWLDEDGMEEKAGKRFGQAARELDRIAEVQLDHQEQYRRARVDGYGAQVRNGILLESNS